MRNIQWHSRTIIRLAAVAVAFAAILAFSGQRTATAANEPLWVNDLAYGSVGGGFYWDPNSGQVWTGERSWHVFAPNPARTATPLWTNDLAYGSAGGGFYWDPVSGQVWTAERGWHYFSRPADPNLRTFGDGTHLVGSEIQPGTYRTRVASTGCYWERLSGLGGTFDEIIDNEYTNVHQVVTILPTDLAFSAEDCGTWTNDLSAITASPTSPFGDGVFIVGTDIAPGLWRAPGGSSCYWERLGGFTGDFDEIEANDFGGLSPVVEIAPNDDGFESSKCGSWSMSLGPITSSPTAPFGEGMFIVGTDIAPGIWRADGGSSCYWTRLSGFSGDFDDVIANDYGDTLPTVQVSPTDRGFESSKCGTWTKIS